jgi:hypothetical protein
MEEILNLSEFPDYLKTLKPKDWKPLIALMKQQEDMIMQIMMILLYWLLCV